jgi:hypothetical protein
MIQSLHKNFARKVWKWCIDRVVLHYTQSLLWLAKNVKYKKIDQLIDKINQDKEQIISAFTGLVDHEHVAKTLEVVDNLQQFIEASPAMIPFVTLTLKQIHGSGFTYSTVKLMMNLRIDIGWSERGTVLDECKDVILNYQDSVVIDIRFYQNIKIQVLEMIALRLMKSSIGFMWRMMRKKSTTNLNKKDIVSVVLNYN